MVRDSLLVLLVAGRPDRPETALLRALPALGIDPIIMCEAGSEAFEQCSRDGLKVQALRCGARVDLRAAREIRAAVKRFAPDIIHAFTGRTLTCALLGTFWSKIPLVAYRGTMGNVHVWDPSAWMSFLHPRVRRISCVSEAVRQDLLSVRPEPETLVTIHKGHDPEWYRATTPIDLTTVGVPPGSRVLVSVANFRALKGTDVIIRALALLPSDVHLVLVGDVRDEKLLPLTGHLKLTSRVHFTGERKDAIRFSAAADLFVMASLRREGFPKAVIEAMSLGIVPVVSAVGGMVEQVEDGVSGAVVAPNNCEALAVALRELLDNPVRRVGMGRMARERVATHFHISQSIQRTLELYRSLV